MLFVPVGVPGSIVSVIFASRNTGGVLTSVICTSSTGEYLQC